MPALARNQASDCANPALDVFVQVNGVLTDITGALEFQIIDVTNPLVPVQAYPPSGRATVDLTDCPTGAKLSTGRYVAKYTPDITEPIGTHRTDWFFKLTPTSPEQAFSEEFEVLPEGTATSDIGYCTVADMRAEGVTTTQASDTLLLAKIAKASRLVDVLTHQWFEPRTGIYTLDGSGSRALTLAAPIIGITTLAIDGSVVDATAFEIYNRHLTQNLLAPDDRKDPRILFSLLDNGATDIYQRYGSRVFPRGVQNIELTGVFGYTDFSSASGQGTTPTLICEAVKMLVVKDLIPMADRGARVGEARAGQVTMERTRDQQINYGASRYGGASGYLTGDPEIDGILEHFMAPLSVGHTSGGAGGLAF